MTSVGFECSTSAVLVGQSRSFQKVKVYLNIECGLASPCLVSVVSDGHNCDFCRLCSVRLFMNQNIGFMSMLEIRFRIGQLPTVSSSNRLLHSVAA